MTGILAIGDLNGKKSVFSQGVTSEEAASYQEDTGLEAFPTKYDLSQFSVSYLGEIPLDLIVDNKTIKRTNWRTRKAVKAAIGVTGFVKPIVLASNYQVIDGQLRLELFRELLEEGHLTTDSLPVIIFDVDEDKATYLRMALNRMGEFPRWDFLRETDDKARAHLQDLPQFVDANPQLQKLLDPFGFYTQAILSEAFFEDTVLQFPKVIENPVYTPEIGLVKWAEIQAEVKDARKAEAEKNPLKAPGSHASLFNLKPEADDFLEVYEIEKEVRSFVLKMREVAGTITENYDEKRKAEKRALAEKKGEEFVWQNARRAPKKVILDKKAEAAERKAQEALAAAGITEDDFDEELGEAPPTDERPVEA